MVHLYSAFNQGAFHRLFSTFTHSQLHSYTDGGGNHARHQPAHLEQLGVQSFAQGLFDTNPGAARLTLVWEPPGDPPRSKDGFSTTTSYIQIWAI